MAEDTKVDERLVEHIWERQAFDCSALGRLGLTVIFRGMPSDAGGPDYQEAVLASAGHSVLTGDVEFHVLTSDWYRHGHHGDRRYNGVVLHVVWNDDTGVTERADGTIVPILALESVVSPQAIAVRSFRPHSLLPHPCVASFGALTTTSLRAVLHELGLARFHERAEAFAADASEQGADQAIYTGLLEALGYASNRAIFRTLADAAPFAWLASLAPELLGPALLDAAGLGPPCGIAIPARLASTSWRLSRVRPTNHPARRLEGVAELLRRFAPSPAEKLIGAVQSARTPAEPRRILMTSDGFIGAGRADEIAISVVLPFVAGVATPAETAESLYLRYPPAPSNRWTRTMQDIFAEAGHALRPRSAAEHQGMHHLYHRHCRYERFRDCPVCGESAPQAAGSTDAMSYQS
jgi:hypothetical protein